MRERDGNGDCEHSSGTDHRCIDERVERIWDTIIV